MLEAVRFLEQVGRLVEGADDPKLVDAARADLEVLRLAEPGSDFLLGADGVRWGRRPLDVVDTGWMSALRAAGLIVLAPPNDAPGFGAWVSQLATQVGSAATASAPSAGDAPAASVSAAPTTTREPSATTPELVGATASSEATAMPAATPEPMAPAEPVADPEPVPPPRPMPTAEVTAPPAEPAARPEAAPAGRSVQAESERIWHIHETALGGHFIVFPEAISLAKALGEVLDEPRLAASPRLISPLDEYSTVHALNVGLLSMRLARHLAFDEEDILGAAVAGFLHDIGKIRLGELPSVSLEMLSPEERSVLQAHTTEGARLLLDGGPGFERAAIVAYEHHMHWHGEGGYPARHYDRPTHPLSRIVAVCDAYDVLRTERSFRPALDADAALSYLRLIGGQTHDPDIVAAFLDLATGPLPRVEPPSSRAPARPHEIGWLPETGYDPDCEPRPVRL